MTYWKKCKECGESFQARRRDKVFHNATCRSSYNRRKKRINRLAQDITFRIYEIMDCAIDKELETYAVQKLAEIYQLMGAKS